MNLASAQIPVAVSNGKLTPAAIEVLDRAVALSFSYSQNASTSSGLQYERCCFSRCALQRRCRDNIAIAEEEYVRV
jgi:hypothetical protein